MGRANDAIYFVVMDLFLLNGVPASNVAAAIGSELVEVVLDDVDEAVVVVVVVEGDVARLRAEVVRSPLVPTICNKDGIQ